MREGFPSLKKKFLSYFRFGQTFSAQVHIENFIAVRTAYITSAIALKTLTKTFYIS